MYLKPICNMTFKLKVIANYSVGVTFVIFSAIKRQKSINCLLRACVYSFICLSN